MIARRALGRAAVAAALLAPAAPLGFADDGLGRLFFSPERRRNLDRQRALNRPDDIALTEDPTLTVNGMVQRSSGRHTVWINGAPQTEGERPGGLSAAPQRRTPGSVSVRPDAAPAAEARVGESIKRSTGETTSPLNDGRIVVRRPATR